MVNFLFASSVFFADEFVVNSQLDVTIVQSRSVDIVFFLLFFLVLMLCILYIFEQSLLCSPRLHDPI